MMKKLSKLFTHNLGLKIISVIVSVALWFIVLNVTDPVITEPISAQLKIIGTNSLKQNNYILLNESELDDIEIRFRIRGSTSNISRLKNSSSLTAYIDLSPIDIFSSSELGKSQPIRVKYEIPNSTNYDVMSISPQEVNIVLDKIITRDMKVSVNKKGGDMEGYVTLTPVSTPEKIQVTGPKSILDTVASVDVDVDTDKAVEDILENRKVKVVNVTGKDITDSVQLNQMSVGINVPVQKYSQVQVLTPSVIGSPAAGYRVTSVTINPKNIEIVGVEKDITKLKSLGLSAIDVTGWTQSQTHSYDMRLYLMETELEIDIRNGTDSEVVATVTIEREIEKNLRIPITEIDVSGRVEGVQFPMPYVDVKIQGIAKDLLGINGFVLKSKLEIGELEPGTHELTVEMTAPSGVSFVGELPKMSVIIAGEETDEENPEENTGDDMTEQPAEAAQTEGEITGE